MFGALNRFISRLDGEPQEQRPGTRAAYGFQVLKNSNAEVPLEPWFDFIIGINGRTLESGDPTLFGIEVRNCAGSTISLGVWSAKGQRIREIYTPVPRDSASLGLSLQWMPLSSSEDVWHILEVTPNSPADLAGLLPYGDYVIGSPEGVIRGDGGLADLVEDHLERVLRLYVYNHEYDVTRLVDITPSRSWGGQGALGCTLGYGALHRLPAPLDEPPHAPGETLFENAQDEKMNAIPNPSNPALPNAAPNFSATTASAEFLVPANMQFQTPAEPPGTNNPLPKRDKRARAQHHFASPAADIDEYFKEGEQRSREDDRAPTPKAGGLPPPPKVGAPPKSDAPSLQQEAS